MATTKQKADATDQKGAGKREGFFDVYEDAGPEGPEKLSKAEKDLLIEEGVAFPVTAVRSGTNDDGAFWILEVELEGEPRTVFFGRGKVFSRDRMLEALQSYLQEEGAEPPEVRIVVNKRSQLLVPAEAPEAE